MSLLTPVNVPVKVYKWDDEGAPTLSKVANCMLTILKACLVTGYGEKEGAGWTEAFSDTGVSVFRPEVGAETDFYLRCSADTGMQMTPQVYLNMTSASAGDLKLQCDTKFKYATGSITGKWVLLATARTFYFFCEQHYTALGNSNKQGAYFFCGDTASNVAGDRLVYLQHTGGGYDGGENAGFLGWYNNTVNKGSLQYVIGKSLSSNGAVSTTDAQCLATGGKSLTTDEVVTVPLLFASNKTYRMVGLYVPLNGAVYSNLVATTVNTSQGAVDCINFGTAGYGDTNLYIRTDNWSY